MVYPTNSPRLVIIGAGIGGLSYAISLKKKLGFNDFIIYERASEVGGCWRANGYPGCSSDVLVHFYSLSSELNPYWNKTYGLQPEILAYWISLAKKHALYNHIVFNTELVSADWDAATQSYSIVTEHVVTRKKTTGTAQILVSAVGNLTTPRIPHEIPGLGTFKGEALHSAEWHSGVDLRNKRVAVIGADSSGAQLIPAISEDPTVQVEAFIRTPAWFTTRPHVPYTNTQKWIFANIPYAMRLHRAWLMLKIDGPHLISQMFPESKQAKRTRLKSMERYILDNSPKRYHPYIVPKHPPGCKRTVADNGFFLSLSRPNVNLNFDGIASVAGTGVLTTKGQLLPFDTIVYATGFIGDQFPVRVRGSEGITIHEYYNAHGGPTAYYGTTIPGFPNFYMLAGWSSHRAVCSVDDKGTGPNIGLPTSTLFMEEVQIGYSLQLVKPVLDGMVASFTVRADATNAYNATLHKLLSPSVHTQCRSWKRTGGTGKPFAPFPWSAIQYWWWLRRPNWDHYIVTDGERWKRNARLLGVLRILKILGSVVVLTYCVGKRISPSFDHIQVLVKNLLTTGW
ncbi:FAD/NAD(P)-binding domain-containing protein [Paxillus ammoniavirescens]|nr:FAD/NAD(P)-binding domain-containing protein [Paxillus ammoniavirescens]